MNEDFGNIQYFPIYDYPYADWFREVQYNGKARIQKEMKDLMQREKESQRMLEEAFKGIGYSIV